jgi:DNA-binding beta-propeller fold protein YncE
MNEKNMKYVKQLLSKLVYQIFIFLLSVTVYSQNLLNGPNDIVFDQLNERYLVSCWAGNNIIAVDMQGNHSIFMNNVINAHGSEIKDSVLYVASRHNLLLINLFDSTIIKTINVPGSDYLGHIALDSSSYVYVGDWSVKRLFKINLSNDNVSTLATLVEIPSGIYYEELNNRLIFLPFIDNAPLLAVSLPDGIISTIRTTNINAPDALCRDSIGNCYISSFTENVIYRFNIGFSGDPEIISTGHNGPSGLGYNSRDNILGVTNYEGNRIDLIDLETTDVEYEKSSTPGGFQLEQNYPNPFNPSTTISYSIPKKDFVSLKVYDVLGNEIATLIEEEKPAGKYEIEFNAVELTSGIYFYRIITGSFVETKSMILLK